MTQRGILLVVLLLISVAPQRAAVALPDRLTDQAFWQLTKS